MKLSVIVCTYNRAYAITPCLDSIVAALSAAAPLQAEIVVVNNASTDDTALRVETWAKTSAFPVTFVYEPQKGIAAARNCGIRASRGALVAFTDDDCRMSPDYVKDLLRHDAADTSPVLRGGRVELGDPSDLPITVKTENTAAHWSRQIRSARTSNLSDTIVGCNMALRREAIDRIGFFDTHFGTGTNIPAGEDTDYNYRAYLADIPIEYVPDMAVSHFHGRKTPSDGIKLFRNYSIGAGALYIKYILKDANLCRPAYWDFKKMIKEIIHGKENNYMGIAFSYKQIMGCYMVGAWRYFFKLVH